MSGVPFAERIAALRARDPGVFGAAHHRWRLAPPWSEAEVAAFEERHGGALPPAYRAHLLTVAASGAGPGNGLFEPGLLDTGVGPRPWIRRYGPLGTPFPYGGAVPAHKGRLPGAMPVAELGCGTLVLLITAGPLAGRMWIDDRANRWGLTPEGELGFSEWLDTWLAGAEAEAADPWRPTPSHANEPDHTTPAGERLDAAALETWAADVRERLEAGPVPVARLGVFRRRGAAAAFEQGRALHDAMAGKPLQGEGIEHDFFRMVLEQPGWSALEISGLLVAWIAEKPALFGRDYLGRPTRISGARRFLVVRTTMSSG